jgi:quercetin dioxygenase-like cupin family protein
VDLTAGSGDGPLWGMASEDLNSTLLSWSAGKGTPAHRNDERDVLMVVVDGSALVSVAGEPVEVHAPAALLIPKGVARQITAGEHGVRYLTVHRVRPGLQIRRRGGGDPAR